MDHTTSSSTTQQQSTLLPQWMVNIENTLTDMQKMTRDFIITTPHCAIMLDMGTGKTLTTLSALSYLQPSGHILVIAPKTIAKATWSAEIEKWNIPLNICSLVVNDKGRDLSKVQRHARYKELIDGTRSPSLVIIAVNNIEDIVTFYNDNNITWPFPTVIIDEAQSFKSYKSNRFKALKQQRPFISRMVQLSGTPVPNNYEDLWSQSFLLDGGLALGANITAFRNRYCYQVKVNQEISKWVVSENSYDLILDRIAHMCLSAKNYELKLPDKIIKDVFFDLDDDSYTLYTTLAKEQVLKTQPNGVVGMHDFVLPQRDSARTNDSHTTTNADLIAESFEAYLHDAANDDDDNIAITPANKAVLRAKLLQIAAGSIYTDDTDHNAAMVEQLREDDLIPELTDPQQSHTTLHTNTIFTSAHCAKKVVMNVHNDKILALVDIINNTDSPVLVAYNYRSDLAKIMHMLPQHGIEPTLFDKSATMITAWNDRHIPVMVIHPGSAGHGLNLQYGGHTMVWVSLPDSLEHYLQTNARLHRPGQTHDVTIYRIIAKDTYDEAVIDNLASKTTVADEFLAKLERKPDTYYAQGSHHVTGHQTQQYQQQTC